jgi:L-galactono-1,4-lactone dehydrogenase
MQDLEYMLELLDLIERHKIPAPAPIEQRWTCSSSAPMSPAYSQNLNDVHSWVGIIMYLPTDDESTRDAITGAFQKYAELCEQELMAKYKAKWHWAKLEAGNDLERLARVRAYLREHYDVDRFNLVRRALDPQNNLGNQWLNSVLPLTSS